LWEANAQANADRAQGLAMLPAGAVERLQDRYDAILTAAEATNPNNQAECDLRMPKLKQKVSGCFRSETRVDAFAVIRSYLSTLRKQSANLFQSLVLTFQRSPPMPRMG